MNGHSLITWPLKAQTCNGICTHVQRSWVILPYPSPPHIPVQNIQGYSRLENQEQQSVEDCQVCIDRMKGKVT